MSQCEVTRVGLEIQSREDIIVSYKGKQNLKNDAAVQILIDQLTLLLQSWDSGKKELILKNANRRNVKS